MDPKKLGSGEQRHQIRNSAFAKHTFVKLNPCLLDLVVMPEVGWVWFEGLPKEMVNL